MIARQRAKANLRAHPAEDGDGTRVRLLKAAATVFAEHGYQDATIRQICERAGANIALVNYYFGDKLELYTDVLRYSLEPSSGGVCWDLPLPMDQPVAALRLLIGAMVDRTLETGEQADLRFRLMLNEFVRPSEATSRVVDVVMRPVYDRLREIVGAILGLPINHRKTRLCVHSILGQVAHFAHAKPAVGLLWPEMLKMSRPRREAVVDHIMEFSLAYLNMGLMRGTQP